MLLGFLPTPVILLVCLAKAAAVESPDPSTTLWYASPAASWEREALPTGNGRLGAMIFGGIGRDRIALNEESVWSGSRAENNRADAAKNLPEIRRLLLEGKNFEAEALVDQSFTCKGAGSGRGHGARVPFGCYQSLGDLHILWKPDFPPIALNDWKWSVIPAMDPKEAMGKVEAAIKPDADEVVLLVAAATNYQGFAGRRTADSLQATQDDIARASFKSYADLCTAHVAEYRTFSDRVGMTLGDGKPDSQAAAELPTGQRLAATAKGGSDPSLAVLYSTTAVNPPPQPAQATVQVNGETKTLTTEKT